MYYIVIEWFASVPDICTNETGQTLVFPFERDALTYALKECQIGQVVPVPKDAEKHISHVEIIEYEQK